MRIANVSGLRQYYREIGAYGDITPDDGSTETFTPNRSRHLTITDGRRGA